MKITRHATITNSRKRRCMSCFEWIKTTSLQFRVHGEPHDREYCLPCCESSPIPEIAALIATRKSGSG